MALVGPLPSDPEHYFHDAVDAANPGRWIGRGATVLGLARSASSGDFETPAVTPEDLEAICSSDPALHAALAERCGRDPDVWGPYVEAASKLARGARRRGWCLVFAAPKSVSLAAVSHPSAAERTRILAAHDGAVDSAFSWYEARSGRTRKGKTREPEDVSLAGAAFTHLMARPSDLTPQDLPAPHLHTHVVVPNLSVRSDGRPCAIDARALYDLQTEALAVYQAELRRRLPHLDFEASGRVGWEVIGVPEAARGLWSARRREIRERAALYGHGGKGERLAQLKTARKKDTRSPTEIAGVIREDLAERFGMDEAWWAQVFSPPSPDGHDGDPQGSEEALAHAEEGWRRLATAVVNARQPDDASGDYEAAEQARRAGAEAAVSEFLEALAEGPLVDQAVVDRAVDGLLASGALATSSWWTKGDALIALAGLAPRGASGDALSAGVDQLLRHPRVIPLDEAGKTFTSDQVLVHEATVLALASVPRPVRAVAVPPLDGLAAEQRRAVVAMCSAQPVSIVQGVSGSGKSTVLARVATAWAKGAPRGRVQAVSFTGSAAEELRSVGLRARTIDAFLAAERRGSRLLRPGGLLIVDEAGQADSARMAALLQMAAERGAKVILVGDERQQRAFGAGGLFSVLVAGLGAAALTTNRRQRDPQDRDALARLRAGRVREALGSYARRGRLEVASTRVAAVAAVTTLVAGGIAQGCDALALAVHRASVNALNLAIHGELVARRVLQGVALAPSRDDRPYLCGERIVCRKNDRGLGVANGTRLQVTGAYSGGLVTVDADGKRRRLPTRYVRASTDYAYASTIARVQGRTVGRSDAPGRVVLYAGDLGGLDANSLYVALGRSRDETHVVMLPPGDFHEAEAQLDRAGDPPGFGAQLSYVASRLEEAQAPESALGVLAEIRAAKRWADELGTAGVEAALGVWSRHLAGRPLPRLSLTRAIRQLNDAEAHLAELHGTEIDGPALEEARRGAEGARVTLGTARALARVRDTVGRHEGIDDVFVREEMRVLRLAQAMCEGRGALAAFEVTYLPDTTAPRPGTFDPSAPGRAGDLLEALARATPSGRSPTPQALRTRLDDPAMRERFAAILSGEGADDLDAAARMLAASWVLPHPGAPDLRIVGPKGKRPDNGPQTGPSRPHPFDRPPGGVDEDGVTVIDADEAQYLAGDATPGGAYEAGEASEIAGEAFSAPGATEVPEDLTSRSPGRTRAVRADPDPSFFGLSLAEARALSPATRLRWEEETGWIGRVRQAGGARPLQIDVGNLSDLRKALLVHQAVVDRHATATRSWGPPSPDVTGRALRSVLEGVAGGEGGPELFCRAEQVISAHYDSLGHEEGTNREGDTENARFYYYEAGAEDASGRAAGW